ncbi:MAG: hypothetical protein CMI60_03080 [Parvibaculum sp.]|nr:hypothetical protein [Parvibaculum sp.]
MANIPLRDLGSVGVITDVAPFNLPPNAFSRANNVRFSNGEVSRSPIFRTIQQHAIASAEGALEEFDTAPHHVFALQSSGGYDALFYVDFNYEVFEGTTSRGDMNSTIGSYSPFTSTQLADVAYINRNERVPIHRTPSATNFTDLPNWTANWRCNSIRAYGDFLLALNMTEGSNSYPNRVRFSDIALANSVPASWDATDATKSAGFNDLVEMTTPIIDGATLGNSFLIYSTDQVWRMDFVGGQFIFQFRKLFSDVGVINQNCIVEVEGRHYVFGENDIYATDGNSHQSIAENRVKDYIFSSLTNSKKNRCFVVTNKDLEEIYFCYPSGDDMVNITDTDGCNRAAVYNYKYNTWSFMDLPNVFSGCLANVNSVDTYATIGTPTYADVGGTYHSQEAGFDRHLIMAGVGDYDNSLRYHGLYGVDLMDQGTLTQSRYTSVNAPVKLERIGIDLDEAQVELTGYKVINKITPQILTPNSDKEFKFTFGAANIPASAPSYGAAQTLNISTDYKLDSRASGRYLSYKLDETTTIKDFAFSGFDLDVAITGRR